MGRLILPRRSLLTGAAALAAHRALAQTIPGINPALPGLIAGGVTYTTWNPSDSGSSVTFSNANRTASLAAASLNRTTRATSHKSSGKLYFEVTCAALGINDTGYIGLATSADPLGDYLGQYLYGYGYASSGGLINNAAAVATYSTWVSNQVISIAVDLTGGKAYFAVNGSWQNGANPATGINGQAISTSYVWYPAVGWATNANTNATTFTLNCGQAAFSYTPPSGFSAWG